VLFRSLDFFNNSDPILKFTLEGEGPLINYLNIQISIEESRLILKWFRKEQKGDAFLHFDSQTPQSVKRANVLNLLSFFDQLRSFNKQQPNESNSEEIKKLKDILSINGYPQHLILNWFSEHEKKTQVRDTEKLFDSTKFTSFVNDIMKARVNVPSDGHCLLHSISGATGIRYQNLVSKLISHVQSNQLMYTNHLPNNWKNQLRDYVYKKSWNSDTVDLIPAFIKDLTKRTIIIMSNENGSLKRTVFKSDVCTEEDTIGVILENNHYNYVDRNQCNKESWKKWFADILPAPELTKEFRKPTITLSFKSDKVTKKIMEKKSTLESDKFFNIVFKSSVKLCDIAKRTNSEEYKNTKVEDNCFPGVVYQATCTLCANKGTKNFYIGETGRSVTTRMTEHCRKYNENQDLTSTSALGEHCFQFHGTQPSTQNWDVEVLCRESKTQNRKTLEAYFIKMRRPNLNRDAGVQLIAEQFCFL
jgi:hypothetical protein